MVEGRVVRLASKGSQEVLEYVAMEDGRIDIGSIAGRFGFDPRSLRLNGYYISRNGPDHISNLTWAQLIGFFEKKGLSSGTDPILLQGHPIQTNQGLPSPTYEDKRFVGTKKHGVVDNTILNNVMSKRTRPSKNTDKDLTIDGKEEKHETNAKKRSRQTFIMPSTSRNDGNYVAGNLENECLKTPRKRLIEDTSNAYQSLWKRLKEVRV